MHPTFSFRLAEKKTCRARYKRKGRFWGVVFRKPLVHPIDAAARGRFGWGQKIVSSLLLSRWRFDLSRTEFFGGTPCGGERMGERQIGVSSSEMCGKLEADGGREMKKKQKNRIIYICVTATFFVQLARGFSIPQQEPGQMASGAMNAPIAVIFSAVLSGVIIWGALELFFWLVSKVKHPNNR